MQGNVYPGIQQSPMNPVVMDGYGRRTEEHVSFRGEPIPDVIPKMTIHPTNSKIIIDKILAMGMDDRQKVTIEAAHFERSRLAYVKLSTGDIISLETAIALAENRLLHGYSTGATMRGGRTLRSKPSTDRVNQEARGIYQLPRF